MTCPTGAGTTIATKRGNNRKLPRRVVIGRLGPPCNLRAGGAHRDGRKVSRSTAERRAVAEFEL